MQQLMCLGLDLMPTRSAGRALGALESDLYKLVNNICANPSEMETKLIEFRRRSAYSFLPSDSQPRTYATIRYANDRHTVEFHTPPYTCTTQFNGYKKTRSLVDTILEQAEDLSTRRGRVMDTIMLQESFLRSGAPHNLFPYDINRLGEKLDMKAIKAAMLLQPMIIEIEHSNDTRQYAAAALFPTNQQLLNYKIANHLNSLLQQEKPGSAYTDYSLAQKALNYFNTLKRQGASGLENCAPIQQSGILDWREKNKLPAARDFTQHHPKRQFHFQLYL